MTTGLEKAYQNAHLATTMTREELIPWAIVGMQAIEAERQLVAVLDRRHPVIPTLAEATAERDAAEHEATVVAMPDRHEPEPDGDGDRAAMYCECGAGPFHHNAHLTRHTKAKHRRSPHPDELEPAP